VSGALDTEAAEWRFAAKLQTEYYDWRLRVGLEPTMAHLDLLHRCEMICKAVGCLTDEKWAQIYGPHVRLTL
jgi:hypothetical protein